MLYCLDFKKTEQCRVVKQGKDEIQLKNSLMVNINNWVGTIVRDSSGRVGRVIEDWIDYWHRIIVIRFTDGSKYDLLLKNAGKDPEDQLGIQWQFSPQEFPEKWSFISDCPKAQQLAEGEDPYEHQSR